MRRVRFTALVVLALHVPLHAAPLYAAEPQTAANLLREGVELRKAHRDQDALAAFERAYELAPSVTALAQTALARAALSEWLQAEADLAIALEADDAWITRNRAELEGVMSTISGHLGWIEIDVQPGGAAVLLDERVLDARRTRAAAGHAVLHVRAPGYVATERLVDVPAGDVLRVEVALTPIAVVAPAKVAAPPAANPLARIAELERRPNRTGPLVLGSAGVIALGVGAYFGIRAFAGKADRDKECDGLACTHAGLERDAEARTAATVSTVSMSIGLGVVLTSVAWLVLLPSRRHSTTGAPVAHAGLIEISTW